MPILRKKNSHFRKVFNALYVIRPMLTTQTWKGMYQTLMKASKNNISSMILSMVSYFVKYANQHSNIIEM